MRKLSTFVLLFVTFCWVQTARADSSSCTTTGNTISCIGNLSVPENVFTDTFVALGSSVTVQTFGFGGGTNAAGQVISAGGFDSLVALFAGTGPTATILVDGSGNPIASADNLTLFSPGCPSAGTVLMGVTNVCGDNALVATLTPGLTYTLLLTDANFVPCAVNPGPPPANGCTTNLSANPVDPSQYGDLTGGVFQTCNFDSSGLTCITPTGNFAVDISPAATPEPATLVLLGSGLLAASWGARRQASGGGASGSKSSL
jgi:PEP-CTERM motif-containing protein